MKKIKLSQGRYALVDGEDFDYLNQWKWCAAKAGNSFYAKRNQRVKETKKYTVIPMHRIIMNATKGMDVDHINGNGLDNRRENLRLCTRAENIRNSRSKPEGTSKLKGVHWHKRDNKWVAQITVDWKNIHLGYFESEIEAHKAYCNAALKYHGDFARIK